MKKILVFITVIFLLQSCESVMKTIKGVKKPKIETYLTTQKYLLKNHIDTTRLVYFKNLNSFGYASKKKLLDVPNVLFFDKSGFFVDYKKSPTDCNAKVGGFIHDLETFQFMKSDSTKTISDIKKLIVSPNKNLKFENSDITVFITWTKWSGALNREKTFDWVRLLDEAKRKGVSVNYYLLNCDFQENWNLTKEEKEALGVN